MGPAEKTNLKTVNPSAGLRDRTGKRRRSKRLPLCIPVLVYGRTPDNRAFRDVTVTQCVSAHGGLLLLEPKVRRGQTVLLVHSLTEEERECRVVYVASKSKNKKRVGVEFTDAKDDFWHVYLSMTDRKRSPQGVE